jgi:hypothetical protein
MSFWKLQATLLHPEDGSELLEGRDKLVLDEARNRPGAHTL